MKTLKNRHGASLVEHGVLVGLVAVVSIGAVAQLGSQMSTSFATTSDSLAVNLDHILPPAERGPLANVPQTCYEGTPGADRIEYNSRETIYNCLHGYAGNDELIWSVHTTASFYPGPGNDKTISGNGDQVHHYESGHDTIDNASGDDTLILPRGTTFSAVTLSASDYGEQDGARNLKIDLAQGSVTLMDQFENGGVSTIILDDRELTRSELSAIVLEPYPTTSSDTLFATYGDDVISPLAGDDVVYAGGGEDRIIYTSGSDAYYPGLDDDVLELPFALSDADFHILGNKADLFITPQAGGQIWAPAQFSVAPWMNKSVRFSSFDFADQTLSWDEMRLHSLRQMETSGNDQIFGTIVDDEIWSDGNNVHVQTNGGNDIIHWVSGDMHLSGKGAGFDILDLSTVARDSITTSTMSDKDGVITLPDGTRFIIAKILQTTEGDGNSPVERILFADGVVLEERAIRDLFVLP